MQLSSILQSFIILCLFTFNFSSCGSPSKSPTDSLEPEWIHHTARSVDGGYIVYIGIGEDRTVERALFKAESAAIQDIANECSFVPKGTRIEDRFDTTRGVLHRFFVKIGLNFDDCEAAKAAVNPDEIRKLANIQFSEQLKRYQDLIDNESGEELAQNKDGGDQNGTPYIQPIYSANNSAIYTPTELFVARQQVVYTKEVVILSPPNAFPPHSPQTAQFVASLSPNVQSLRNYEHQNPQIRNWTTTWSTLKNRPYVPRPQSLRSSPSMRFQQHGSSPNSMRNQSRLQNNRGNPERRPRKGRGRRFRD